MKEKFLVFPNAFLEHFRASNFLPSSQSTMVATIIEFPKHILTLFGVTKKTLDAAVEKYIYHRKSLLWFCWNLNQMKYKKESVFLLCYIKSIN